MVDQPGWQLQPGRPLLLHSQLQVSLSRHVLSIDPPEQVIRHDLAHACENPKAVPAAVAAAIFANRPSDARRDALTPVCSDEAFRSENAAICDNHSNINRTDADIDVYSTGPVPEA